MMGWMSSRRGRRGRAGVVASACALVLLLGACTVLDRIGDTVTDPSSPQDADGPRQVGGATTVVPAEEVGAFRAVRVADGDTLEAVGNSGRHSGEAVRIRLAIVDSAELGMCGAAEATDFVVAWLAQHDDEFVLRRPVDAPQRDPFDRVLGEVLGPPDDEGSRPSLNVALVTAGLGRIDDRFGAEDPDLLRRLRAARADAPSPACPDLHPPQGLLGDDGAGLGPDEAPGATGDGPVTYGGCDEVRAAGAAPLLLGEPGYDPSMDGDGDGIACE